MSIFLLFLRRLCIALDANSHIVLKQCVASNRYARKICENFSKCLGGGIPPGQARSCRKLLHFRKRYKLCSCRLFAHTAPIKMAIATHVEQPICTVFILSEIKVQVCPLVPADLWQIFAVLASRAIALKTLFERRARVCLKSNP